MKVCLTNLQGLGNSIINLPLLKALHKQHDVDLLTWRKNGSTKFYQDLMPEIHTIGFGSFKEIWDWDSPRYDIALGLFPVWKREHLSLWFARAKIKINFWLNNKPYSWPFFKHMPYTKSTPDFEVNAAVFEKIFKVTPTEDDFVLKHASKKKLIVIHPTASSVYKFYPAKLFADFIKHFKDDHELVMISGSDAFEVEFCQEIIRLVGEEITYKIKAPFTEIVDLLAEAEYFLGLDSAIGHLAAICSCKVLSLWSFADFDRVPPYAIESFIFLSKKSMEDASENPGVYLDCRDMAQELSVDKLISVVEGKARHPVSRKLKYRQGQVYLIYY